MLVGSWIIAEAFAACALVMTGAVVAFARLVAPR
jgi:hypothetical protein